VLWAERWAARHDVDLRQSFFYTDSITDVPVLERVGEPRVVNPDPRLRREAARRGWPVFDLDRRTTAPAPLDRGALCAS
jgi:phosphoserine phosphatase